MTVNEAPVGHADEEQPDTDLELLTDDGEQWTAVPADADGDEQLTQWITVDVELLRPLERWR